MTAPPRLATWLLEAALATSERDAIVGDLEEEFAGHVLPARGTLRAQWWYCLQVARSLAPLLGRAWERASLRRACLALISALALAATPASLLMMLRSFVLQQVPLKTTSEASLSFVLLLAALVLLAGGLGFAGAVRVLNAESRER